MLQPETVADPETAPGAYSAVSVEEYRSKAQFN